MATPSALPTWRDMFSTALPVVARSAGRVPAEANSGACDRPAPVPPMISPGKNPPQYPPWGEVAKIQNNAAAAKNNGPPTATRWRPKIWATRLLFTANTAAIRGPGTIASPARTAEYPHASSRNKTVTSSQEAKPRKKMNSARLAVVNARDWNSVRSMTACGCTIERQTAAATRTVVIAYRLISGALAQPRVLPSMVTKTTAAMAKNTAPTENGSGRRAPRSARISGSSAHPAPTVATPIGTLTRKIQRQSIPTSSPPTGAPELAATAATPAQMPTT